MSKTIQFNPGFFNLGGKTRKNREKKERAKLTPLISPNVVRDKFLKRIKEHKAKEFNNQGHSSSNQSNATNNKKNTISDIGIYTDEFNDSIEYLKNLSQKNYELQKERARTLKHYTPIQEKQQQPYVALDLPDTLKMPTTPLSNSSVSLQLNKPLDPPPYGCLKGGTKPTYKNWTSMTQKNQIVTNPQLSVVIDNTDVVSDRENRMQALKEKIKMKQNEKQNDQRMMSENLIHSNSQANTFTPVRMPIATPTLLPDVLQNNDHNEDNNQEHRLDGNKILNHSKNDHPQFLSISTTAIPSETNHNQTQQVNINDEIESQRQLIKKTITRKYKLGRHKEKNSVGILIKNRDTRKKVLHAQKELKKKPINDVKQYLKEHALLKIGSNAPNDVLRKMYESAMLSGEINNNNKEVLLHNFMKDKDAEE